MSLLGIDFGNANCIVSCVSRGNVDVALNEASMREIPNVICIQEQRRLIGGQAYTQVCLYAISDVICDCKHVDALQPKEFCHLLQEAHWSQI